MVRDRTEGGEDDQTIFIEDTAHCADMASRRATDRRSLKTAKEVCRPEYNITVKSAQQSPHLFD